MTKPTYFNFDKTTYPWRNDIDYRHNPDLYRVGKGEQGVLICEPYKSEIGKYWRFKTPEVAKESSAIIFGLFKDYLSQGDFVGADMARKYLQMGFTRARRYTNYKGGRKYDATHHLPLEKGTGSPEKALSADVFYQKWQEAESYLPYKKLKSEWKQKNG